MTSRATHALFNGNQKIDQNKKTSSLKIGTERKPTCWEMWAGREHSFKPSALVRDSSLDSSAESRASVFKNYFTEVGG